MATIQISAAIAARLLTPIDTILREIDGLGPVENLVGFKETVQRLRGYIDPLSRIEQDEFERIRRELLVYLKPCSEVTQVSRNLWLVLNLMTKIFPFNEVCIFDWSTPVPTGEQASADWFYASSGHAYPLALIVRCQDGFGEQRLFLNPCIGPGRAAAFNHHD